MTNPCDERIAIIGGGIAGLFCALILKDKAKLVNVFETSDRLGGRIRTIRLDKYNRELGKNWKSDDLEFYVEFGPMRIELEKQLLLSGLLNYLGIKTKSPSDIEGNGPYLRDFPAYGSPTSVQDPQYELKAEEVGRKPFELLQMALLRVVVNLEGRWESGFGKKKDDLIRQISVAAATQQPVDRVFTKWVKGLEQQDYWDIQTQGHIAEVPLYAMGFWNLLSDHLSHNAIVKLRDLGTFYHLLPENPNAAEWVVWWLIGLSISEKLQGVFGGMECIVDRLVEKLEKKRLLVNCWVTRIAKTESNRLILDFSEDKRPSQEIASQEYDRIILALPRRALQDIVRKSDVFQSEGKIDRLLDSAFGFPMVKTFVVVKDRWWEEDNRANRFATRVPTRELHYWKGQTKGSKQGLIMAYTDRPASSFWANYVPSGSQIDAHRSNEMDLGQALAKRLKEKVVQYINENNIPDITAEDIVWYGIRDWGRSPYSGANHAWRPERKYWVVMRRLSDIPVVDTDRCTIHICGEAYSDYHGFMEGSLRSAAYALHRILDLKEDGTYDRLPWLREKSTDSGNDSALQVDVKYLEALRTWAAYLDSVDPKGSFLYGESV